MTKQLLSMLLEQGGKVEHREYIRALKTVTIDAGTRMDSLRSEILRRGLVRHHHVVEITDAGLKLLAKAGKAAK